MTKRKNQKKSLSTSSSTEPSSLSPTQPQCGLRKRQLSRFYEPLVLLYTLGRTRGEHSCAQLSTEENVSQAPLKELRRRFLSELAYTCDFDKGGDTVTAIGLESTPQKFVFWVASNSCPRKKIVPFLESLLTKLRDMSNAAAVVTPERVNEIAAQCIGFATPRIKKYRSLLNPLLRRCHEYFARTEREDVTGLAEWLKTWERQLSPMELCQIAYENRKSASMHTLARLGVEPTYKSNQDAIHHTFALVRHYIGRLGHHFRAAKVLLSCTSRLSELLHGFEVCSIPTPPKSVVPPARRKTRLESIIVRMLPANSLDLDRYQRALIEMDAKYQLESRFLEHYADPNLKPRVHAEVQVLEQFYANNLSFAADDPFIACSKPACFCCLLYFRHHPGHFVEPMSHHKIYLNWRPPDLNHEDDIISQNCQRDILISMTRDVRKEALRQIDEKIAPHAWHPDSLTGITESVLHEHWQGSSKAGKEPFPTIEAPTVFDEAPVGSEETMRVADFDSALPTFDDADTVSFSMAKADSVHCSRQAKLPQKPQPILYDFEDDSEQEGGVLL